MKRVKITAKTTAIFTDEHQQRSEHHLGLTVNITVVSAAILTINVSFQQISLLNNQN